MSGDQSKPCVMWSEFACSQHGAADWMLQRHWEESLVHCKWIYQAVSGNLAVRSGLDGPFLDDLPILPSNSSQLHIFIAKC